MPLDFKIGSKFICYICKKEDVVSEPKEDAIALYEVESGYEFKEDEVVMICDQCHKEKVG